MNICNPKISKHMVPGLLTLALIGCQAEKEISFTRDVMPIIDKYCMECHQTGGAGLDASGFSMESYEDLMKGTRGGAMIISGDSAGSNMLVLMEGRADPSIAMPHGKREPATSKETGIIRLWIDQGAKNN